MKYLFSKGGIQILESLSFTRTLFAFDFDGTLSKIVPIPARAFLSTETARLLRRLNERAPVAVISGRSIQDLKTRLPFTPRHLIGNHGLEGLSRNDSTLDLAREACHAWRDQLKKMLNKRMEGIEMEDKTYSMALHYRHSPQKKQAKLHLLEAASRIHPSPRIILGKKVVNLIPVGGPHKGIALVELMLQENIRSACYIGDDDTDEDVFALSDRRILGIRVGRRETSLAKFFIKRQSEMNKLLRRILSFYEQSEQ